MDKLDQMLEYPKAPTPDNGTVLEIRAGEMDNQQERLDLARIAMFIDTDGCISMRVSQRLRNRDSNLVPMVSFTNTSMPLIEWTAETLSRLGVPRYVQMVDMKKYIPNRARLVQGRITILGIKRNAIFLPKVLPFLIAKKRQAEVLIEFCQSRLAQGHKARYTDHDCELANLVRSLNSNKAGAFRPVSSESIRQAGELRRHLSSKMCSDLRRDAESATEMLAPVDYQQ